MHLPPGTDVVATGLKTRSDLNGKCGKVSANDPENGRCQVLFEDADSAPLALRRENLCMRTRVTLKVSERVSREDNAASAKSGFIRGYAFDSMSYEVDFPDGASATIPIGNIVIPTGSPGLIVGLQARPDYNGKPGRLIDFDHGADRYVIAMDSCNQLRLKRSNFRI